MQPTHAYNIADSALFNTYDGRFIPAPIDRAISAVCRRVDDVSFTALIILQKLISFAKVSNLALPVFPSVSTLAKLTKKNERAIYRALKELSDAQYIQRLPQDRKSKGRMATVRTVLTRRVAAITGMPYDPYNLDQRSLFEKWNPHENTEESGGTEKVSHTRNPVPHDQFIGTVKPRSAGKVPEDLRFLLDQGAKEYQIFNWMGRLKHAADDLSGIVAKKIDNILTATNPIGYLVSLVKLAESGEEIKAGYRSQPNKPEICGNLGLYFARLEKAKRELGGKIIEWDSPDGKRWIRVEKQQDRGQIFMTQALQNGQSEPSVQKSVLAITELIQSGQARIVGELQATSEQETKKWLDKLSAMVNVGRRSSA
jgi:hypothetical protein